MVATIPNVHAYDMVYDSGKSEIFFTVHGSNAISIISDDSNTVSATIPIPSGLEYQAVYGLCYDSSHSKIFVTSFPNIIAVISDITNTVIDSIVVNASEGTALWEIAYDSNKEELFVANTVAGGPGAKSSFVINTVLVLHTASTPINQSPTSNPTNAPTQNPSSKPSDSNIPSPTQTVPEFPTTILVIILLCTATLLGTVLIKRTQFRIQ